MESAKCMDRKDRRKRKRNAPSDIPRFHFIKPYASVQSLIEEQEEQQEAEEEEEKTIYDEFHRRGCVNDGCDEEAGSGGV